MRRRVLVRVYRRTRATLQVCALVKVGFARVRMFLERHFSFALRKPIGKNVASNPFVRSYQKACPCPVQTDPQT